MAGHTYFISDLHLSEDRDDITRCFETFMREEAPTADALYILGDLFEVWVGDDDQSSFNLHIADIIAQVGAKMPVYFIHGNRDFAIRDKFAAMCKMTLLPEQYVIDLYGAKVLISHGDELCTRDLAYMKFRKKARGWWWPRLMLSLPLRWRQKVAANGRETSKDNKQKLHRDIMDVTKSEVDKAMLNAQVNTFIHGHTHRPKIHNFTLADKAVRRIVLGDWYSQGSILIASKEGISLEQRQFR